MRGVRRGDRGEMVREEAEMAAEPERDAGRRGGSRRRFLARLSAALGVALSVVLGALRKAGAARSEDRAAGSPPRLAARAPREAEFWRKLDPPA